MKNFRFKSALVHLRSGRRRIKLFLAVLEELGKERRERQLGSGRSFERIGNGLSFCVQGVWQAGFEINIS